MTFNSLVFYIKTHPIIPIIKKKPKIAPPIARTPNIIGPKIVKNKRIQIIATTISSAAPKNCNSKPFMVNKKARIKPIIRENVMILVILLFSNFMELPPLTYL